ncbi:MAG: lysophospholipid acyltransferase family protein [Luteimonas sp.]
MLLKLLALFVATAVLVPIQWLLLALTHGPASMVLPAVFHRMVCIVLGLRVEVHGAPVASPHAIFISNHLSYLDVPVIGSVLRACFVAKDEVRGWPLLGPLARLQHTVFVSRNPRRAAAVSASLGRALGLGHRLVLFPEGTTSDGSLVLPFKSSVFAVLADPALAQVVLQPITIELLTVDGQDIGRGGNRDGYAYYGDMQLLPHLLAFMRGTGARLRLTLHAPVQQSAGMSRKSLAKLAHARISQRVGFDDSQAAAAIPGID